MPEDVSLGELYRAVESLREDHGGKLDRIDERTQRIDRQLVEHATRLEGHDRDIRDALANRSGTKHEQRRMSDRGDAISVSLPVTTKTVLTILLALAALLAAWAQTAKLVP